MHLLGPASTLARHVVERTPGRARASIRMASGGAMIRVDHGAKNALQTLLQHALDVGKSDSLDSLITHLPKILPDAGKSSLSSVIHSLLRHAGYSWDSNRVWLTAAPHEKSELRATAGPTTSRPAAPRVAMQQLPTDLEHDAGAATEATRAADAARPPAPRVMATTAPGPLDRLGARGSGWGSVARPLGACFICELVRTDVVQYRALRCTQPHPLLTRGPSLLTTAVLGHARPQRTGARTCVWS